MDAELQHKGARNLLCPLQPLASLLGSASGTSKGARHGAGGGKTAASQGERQLAGYLGLALPGVCAEPGAQKGHSDKAPYLRAGEET